MKKTLVFKAFYVIEMPDINETSPVYQDMFRGKVDAALEEASDNWLMQLEDIWDGNVFED